MANKTGNSSLSQAKKAKNDEFYTQLTDIEKECNHYWEHFHNKIVLCNCDDPFESFFFKYFCIYFNKLKLKKLIATCYDGSPILGNEFMPDLFQHTKEKENPTEHRERKAYYVEINEVRDFNGDGAIDMSDIMWLLENRKNVYTILKGNGDFRSPECVELLKQADIVVTNPPFSLFREFVAQLIEYDKKFLIIGNQNALTYKEIFPLIKDNKMWLGYRAGDMAFRVPAHYEIKEIRFWQDETGQKWRSLGNICWFTNCDIKKRHEEMILIHKYSPDKYPKYDNYDAINVDKVTDIPCDYDGVIGVPITFLDKYNPEQWEIVGCSYNYGRPDGWDINANMQPIINGKTIYKRIFIRKRKDYPWRVFD